MEDLCRVSVVLPSLDPDEKLLRVVDGLLAQGFCDIILVNDGSKAEKLSLFEAAAAHPQVTLLHHPQNLGKGAALKTAFRWFLEHRQGYAGVITVDGDDQHHPEDTRACAEEMLRSGKVILGCRDFDLPHVPDRSRKGNKITCWVFKMLCGMTISDTQTGLRAIPADAVRAFCGVKGDRFEYETNMLLAMKEQGIAYGEVKIRTVYIEENQSSHFRAVRDSVRIYKLLLGHFFRFAVASLLSAVLDIGVYSLVSWLMRDVDNWTVAVVPFVVALAASSCVNFLLNKNLVFHNHGSVAKTAGKYFALVLMMLCLRFLLSNGLYWLLHIGTERVVLRTVIYSIVMSGLYFISFFAQQRWVFSGRSKGKDK